MPHAKNLYPKISPIHYNNNHLEELSIHRTRQANSFGTALRKVDVRMVIQILHSLDLFI